MMGAWYLTPAPLYNVNDNLLLLCITLFLLAEVPAGCHKSNLIPPYLWVPYMKLVLEDYFIFR